MSRSAHAPTDSTPDGAVGRSTRKGGRPIEVARRAPMLTDQELDKQAKGRILPLASNKSEQDGGGVA